MSSEGGEGDKAVSICDDCEVRTSQSIGMLQAGPLLRQLLDVVEGMGKRFDVLDQRFDGMNQRFNGVDQRFDGVNQRLDGVASKEKLEVVHSKVAHLHEGAARAEIATRFGKRFAKPLHIQHAYTLTKHLIGWKVVSATTAKELHTHETHIIRACVVSLRAIAHSKIK